MRQEKYIGMDVHQATISVAVVEASGKLIMECLLETKASTIVEFIQGLQGTMSLTFEEGTSAAWLHDLLKPHVSQLVVCDPRKNALLKDGSKSDRIDARKLAELLRTNQLKAVYHGEHGTRTLKELGRSYLTITQDVTRVMNRIKSEESVQRCCHFCQHTSWPHARLLCGSGGERNAADDGASHPGTEDCRDQFNHVEERSEFRSPTVASASNLSISEEQAFHLCRLLRWCAVGFWRCSVRG